MELRVQDGRAVVAGRDGGDERAVDPHNLPLGAGLADALHEWAKVADAVARADSPSADGAGDLLVTRGRQLATRLAADMRTPVEFTDPVSGVLVLVEPEDAPEPVDEPAEAGTPEVGPAEPTPWATGLTVSVFSGAVMAIMVVTLSEGLGETSRWLALLANVLVVGGIAPSVWLARRVPVWRWVAYGVTAGVLVAWFALILTLLDAAP
ncbi:DUF2537 domain-containing protein [Saccharothrix violaceirubra]|uniref:DUF2537 domain-containing protein n=1 Tax=Saccharothrix violaceirubra TaxID=413306 RepID=A0A7W7T8V0_9PSEU|nr:DUF2537 domain-containing protein [Saccharothrix violaceirubra]MBB4968722.1 hypothetical protein [Saccharothrix violaceirubra]